mgnify:CR=1 FL=1
MPPDLVCTSESEFQFFNTSLDSRVVENGTLYRFSKGSLYLSSESREEYLYGELEEMEYLRYVTGHKTIIFNDSSFLRAVTSHFNETYTRVIKLHCVKT